MRFRLTRTEVKTLCAEGFLQEQTPFPNGVFTYSVRFLDDIGHLSADLTDRSIELQVPRAIACDWHDSGQVGFSHTVHFQNGQELFLLLEKDFACLDNTSEDQSDNYPNPKVINS